jgi:ABC-type antimicrobial peptide transport system permease subunit
VILITTVVGVIIVISTIGIVIFINTARKKRIIGVLKAVGMQENTILYIFLFESLLFGLIGSLLGVALLYASLYAFAANPITLPIGVLIPVIETDRAVSAVAILLISSVVAGFLPSRMASKQEILDNLKTVE